MARIASLSKMGYYRTPDKSTEKIIQKLSFEGDKPFHILDPCCGEGIALNVVSSINQNIITYGVELEKSRANASREKLSKVINCSIYDAEISKKSFGLLWLNPPYAFDNDTNNKSIRTELKFLIKSADWIAPKGIIVYIIPDYIVDKRLANFFTSHFEDISVNKFVTEEYEVFKQVAIFGIKAEKQKLNEIASASFVGSVRNASFFKNNEPEIKYQIPSTPSQKIFRSKIPCIDEMASEIRNSRLNQDVNDLTGIVDKISRIKTVMPIKKGHLAMLLVAGFLDGVIEKNSKRILVKGYSKKVTLERQEEGEGKNPVIKLIKTDKVIVAVRFIDIHGNLTNIN